MSWYLVTGGAGFIGRHLAAELLRAGHAVRIVDALVEQVHGGVQPSLPEGVEFIHADLCDRAAVRHALRDVEGVFHLAAEVGVGQSMYEIARYVRANDLGTAVLLEALIEQPVRRVVVASSMSVYGEGLYRTQAGMRRDEVRRSMANLRLRLWDPAEPDGTPLIPIATDETKPPDLASIYALGKFVQERAVLMCGRAYGMEAVALRLFNVFGPGQALSNPYTGVLANFASRLLNGQRPLIFEDGQQRRDFVHVRDVARAFHLAMTTPAADGEVLNIGSGRAYTILEVANRLAAAMGSNQRPEVLAKARAGDIRHCFADIGRATRVLGFTPTHWLEDSLAEMVAWVAEAQAHDRGDLMRRELEARGLVT